jgi:hypothetical protein
MTYSIDGIRPETRAAIEAVERRLELARSGVGEQDITSKGGGDLATATDIGVEDVARSIVGDAIPCPNRRRGAGWRRTYRWVGILATDTATSCPAWTRRSPREWMGSDGRLSSEGFARDAMTHIRWGRILEHAAEIGRVTVKPPSGVAFQGRDRSTDKAPSPRGCCRGTLARGHALTSSEPGRRRR